MCLSMRLPIFLHANLLEFLARCPVLTVIMLAATPPHAFKIDLIMMYLIICEQNNFESLSNIS